MAALLLSFTTPTLALTTGHHRQLSYANILTYAPASSVSDHARIDVDQKALEGAFETCGDTQPSDCTGMEHVKAIYQQGGGSGLQGQCEVDAISEAFDKKAPLQYRKTGETEWTDKKTSSAGEVGGTNIKFYYATSSERKQYEDACVVGGILQDGEPEPDKCLTAGDDVKINGVEYSCKSVDNTQAARTLQGFSTKAKKLMYAGGCPERKTDKPYMNGCPYTSFLPYWNYYCSTEASACYDKGDYANQIILQAMAQGKTALTNGNIDFTNAAGIQLKEVIKKATAYMNAWMYAIREFEDAIDDCTGNQLTKNDMSSGSVHAWDEGVAFYTGHLLETGHLSGAVAGDLDTLSVLNSGIGKLAYDLGNKRCKNFGVCGRNGDTTIGQSQQNYMLFDLFTDGQILLRTGNCDVVSIKDKIVQWMTIPLIQGTLRYAFETGPAGSGADLKGRAEGAIFALAVLPQVHACSATHAETIYTNMVGKMTNGEAISAADFNAVKAAFEACYPKIFPDIPTPCAAVGNYGGSDGKQDLTAIANTAACVDPAPAKQSTDDDDDDLSTGAIVGIAVAAGFALLCACAAVYMMLQEKAGKPVFTSSAKPPA